MEMKFLESGFLHEEPSTANFKVWQLAVEAFGDEADALLVTYVIQSNSSEPYLPQRPLRGSHFLFFRELHKAQAFSFINSVITSFRLINCFSRCSIFRIVVDQFTERRAWLF